MASKVFIVGGLGYLGGSVLHLLLQQRDKYAITALVRSDADAVAARAVGVTPVLGNLADFETLQVAAEEADVVFNFADSDALPPVQAITAGLRQKGKTGLYIHTSGTGVISDNSKGEYASEEIYSDLDIAKFHAIPSEAPHRNVDEWILEHTMPHVPAIIVSPPLIFGQQPAGTLKPRQSMQIPLLVKTSIRLGRAATLGKGLAIWNHIHVQDLAEFYVLLLAKALAGEADTGRDGGWYFVESGQHQWRALTQRVAEILHKEGKLPSAELGAPYTDAEIEQYMWGPMTWMGLGSNSRCTAERARKLGWQPQRPDIFNWLEEDVKAVLAAS